MDLAGAVVTGVARTWGAQMTAFGSRGGAPFLVSYSEEGEPREAVLSSSLWHVADGALWRLVT